MKRIKKKEILSNSLKDLKNCYLCNIINLTHEHSDIISPLLKSISQWDTKRLSQTKSIHNYQCFICNYNSKHFKKWKIHIMSREHMRMCHVLNGVCSYFCKACKILFYGPEDLIYQHQKSLHSGNKNNLSNISILMSELMNCLNSMNHSIQIYFCAKCKTISDEPIHTSGEHLTSQTLYNCKYCNITFLCNDEELDFHEASVEHLTFKCIYSINKTIEVKSFKLQKQVKITKTTNDFCTQKNSLELPLIILDRFQKTLESMAKCNFCNVNVIWNTQKIVKHTSSCLNKGDLTSEIHKMLITVYDCKICNFNTNSFFNYKLHIISPKHLTNCHTNGDFYSYFCIICNLYIYGSEIQINNHLKKKHKTTKITDLPFLSKVLKDNYKHVSNHLGTDFINYYSDQQFCEKDFFPVQCNACKISFCNSNYEHKLHEISSEHIILKYFTPKDSSLVMEHNFKHEHLQTTSNTKNANFIINKEYSSTKTVNSNLEECSVNKDCKYTKKRKLSANSSVLDNYKLFKNCNESQSLSIISSTNTNHNLQQNVFIVDDDDDDNDNISMTDSNSTKKVSFINHVQEFLNCVPLSSNDPSQKNIMFNKLENKNVSQEEFSNNTINIDHTKIQKNIQSNESQSNIKTSYKQLHPTDADQAYGQYVIERLKNIQNLSIKSSIKTEIDALFYTYSKFHY